MAREDKGHVKTRHKVEGGANPISELFHVKKTSDDEALIDVKVANPLHKIAQILEQIKNHQSTTVSLRFTIPLIALPIVMLLAFQWGRVQTACTPVYTTKTGILKNISQNVPAPETNWEKFTALFPFIPRPDPAKNLIPTAGTVLVEQEGSVVRIIAPNPADMVKFENQLVFASGNYAACSSTLEVLSSVNITPH